MEEQVLKVERREDGLVILTLQRARRRNALGRVLVTALRETVAALHGDRVARVVVITGAGDKAFCAGADLKERAEMNPQEVEVFVRSLRAMMDEIAALPQPTIAALNGAALGGGFELALACDMRVALPGAVIGLPETHLGIIPGAGGTQRLSRLVGASMAKELIFTSRRVQGVEAQRLGLVSRVAPEGQLMECCAALAAPILTAAPIALAQAKRAIDEGIELSLAQGLLLEQECYGVTIPTEDRLEALAAFGEKRKPVFQGK